MGLWRDLLRLLGLSSDARVHISAPGIDVVITGEPEQVRSLLLVVKHELERNARWRDRSERDKRADGSNERAVVDGKRPAKRPKDKLPSMDQKRPPQLTPGRQYVQPSELDEMDSPYALPDPLVMPVEETTDETEATGGKSDREHAKKAPYGGEIATLVPEPDTSGKVPIVGKNVFVPTHHTAPGSQRMDERPIVESTSTPGAEIAVDATPPPSGSLNRAMSVPPLLSPSSSDPGHAVFRVEPSESSEEGEREVTHVTANPSGPHPAQSTPAIVRGASPFVTDGGPTLTPLSDSDPSGKVVPKKSQPPPLPATDPRDLRTLDSEISDSGNPSERT
jgi:hypothetical protein